MQYFQTSEGLQALPFAALTAIVACVVLRLLWVQWQRWQHSIVDWNYDRDQTTMTSTRLALRGRPDRMAMLRNGTVVPIELTSGTQVRENKRLQLATYLLLCEDHFGRRPPFGFIALQDESLVRVPNTWGLRNQVFRAARRIRRQRRYPNARAQGVTAHRQKCRNCGFVEVCGRRRL
ncbi:MAG: Dna2/Cas4 domain-containing protein [Myxococcales bacterium]|nr:Dna2/Cas4 domain-containing protein [Myxococcales bacterium]